MPSSWDEVMAIVTLYREGIKIVVGQDWPFIGWATAAVKVALVTSSYTPSQAHTSYSNVSAYEISGGDYTLGGVTLASKTIATVSNQLRLDGADVSWNSVPVKPRYAIIYDSTNLIESQRTLFGYMDLGTLRGRKLRIKWPASGVLTITVENAVGFP